MYSTFDPINKVIYLNGELNKNCKNCNLHLLVLKN